MYNINIFEHIQNMCLLHYNIIQWDSEESQLTYEVLRKTGDHRGIHYFSYFCLKR